MTQHIAGIARAAMLVTLNIGTYSARKQDKATQAEITQSKGSGSSRAASVYKNLFAECAELDAITKFHTRVRNEHYKRTLPWDDNNTRLLPTQQLVEYRAFMGRAESEGQRLVDVFADRYDTLVAAAAFQLGSLFNRNEYPTREQVVRKFRISANMTPLPLAGDFRLDIETRVQDELAQQYEDRIKTQLAAANQEAWTRLHDVLTRMSERLTPNEDGSKKIFHDTTITNTQELCDLLTRLNVTGDPVLEKARAQVEAALSGIAPKDVRESMGVRTLVKQDVDKILSAFDWGCDDGEV